MGPVQPAWKIISLLLGLGVFLGVGAVSLSSGDELLWSVVQAMGAFIACWIVLSYLGSLLNMITERPSGDPDYDGVDESGNERG